MVRTRRLVLLLLLALALTMLSPLAFYTSRLPTAFNPIQMRDFLGEITNQMSGVFGFFSFVLVGGFGILYGFCLGF